MAGESPEQEEPMKSTAASLLFAFSILSAAATHAAIVKVQDIGTGTAPPSAPIILPVPAGGVAFGDVVLLQLAFSPTVPPPAVVDSKGNPYVIDGIAPSTSMSVAVYRGTVLTALVLGDLITVLPPGPPGNFMAASATEFSGLIFPASPVDTSAIGTGVSPAPTTGPTGPTAQANELLLGAVGTLGTGAPSSFTPGSGYTALGATFVAIGPAALQILPEFQIVSATGTYVADGTFAFPPQEWDASIVTYEDVVAPVTLQSFTAE